MFVTGAQTVILIAIGSNLPGPGNTTPVETCKAAVEALRALPNLRIHLVSNWWQSAPIPRSDQPEFVNGVVALVGSQNPNMLLTQLHGIENRFGRQRLAVNSARSLDLDIIAMGNTIRSTPPLILPHPRAHERAFVLCPLLEVRPNWVHPTLKQTAQSLLMALSEQSCCRIK